ncbi:MAG: phage tail tube protein, partial [Pseudomonadota bacterium]
LVKIGDGADPEVFSTLCGITTKTMTVNNNSFDVTTTSCTAPGGQFWTEVMTGARSISLSGNGIFEGGTSLDRFQTVVLGTGETDTADATGSFQVVVPEFGTFEGTFHVDNIEFGSEQEGAVTYSFSLQSSGYISFTAD